MTRDELLEKINFSYSAFKLENALLAVVELHSVQETTVIGDPKCDACSGLDWEDYPCPTIQAIEKALS